MVSQITQPQHIVDWSQVFSVIVGPTSILLLGVWINRSNKRKDELQRQLDRERDRSVNEWRSMITEAIRDYGTQIKALTEMAFGKVTWDDCEKREEEIRTELHDIRETCVDKMKQVRVEIAEVRHSLTNHLEHHK